MIDAPLPKLGKVAQAFLEGAGHLAAYNDRSLPRPQLEALAARSEAVAKEIEAKLGVSGAGKDLNMAFRALRLAGEVKTNYRDFRAARIIDMAKALGLETAKRSKPV